MTGSTGMDPPFPVATSNGKAFHGAALASRRRFHPGSVRTERGWATRWRCLDTCGGNVAFERTAAGHDAELLRAGYREFGRLRKHLRLQLPQRRPWLKAQLARLVRA